MVLINLSFDKHRYKKNSSGKFSLENWVGPAKGRGLSGRSPGRYQGGLVEAVNQLSLSAEAPLSLAQRELLRRGFLSGSNKATLSASNKATWSSSWANLEYFTCWGGDPLPKSFVKALEGIVT